MAGEIIPRPTLTPAANQENFFSRLATAPDFTQAAVRGMDVASEPFKLAQEQQRIINAQTEAQGRLGIAQAEMAAAQAQREQQARQFQAEQANREQETGIRQAQQQLEQQRFQHQLAVDEMMKPLVAAQRQAQISNLQFERDARQRTLENMTHDQNLLRAFTKRFDALEDKSFMEGGAQALKDEYYSQFKTTGPNSYAARAEKMFKDRYDSINSKELGRVSTHWNDQEWATYKNALSSGASPQEAMGQANTAYQNRTANAKELDRVSGKWNDNEWAIYNQNKDSMGPQAAMGLATRAFQERLGQTGVNPITGRQMREVNPQKDKDLDYKAIRDHLHDVFFGDPSFFPKDENGRPDFNDPNGQAKAAAAVARTASKTWGLVRQGDIDGARDILGNPDHALGYAAGTYDPTNPNAGIGGEAAPVNPNSTGSATIDQYLGTKPNTVPSPTPTPAAGNAPASTTSAASQAPVEQPTHPPPIPQPTAWPTPFPGGQSGTRPTSKIPATEAEPTEPTQPTQPTGTDNSGFSGTQQVAPELQLAANPANTEMLGGSPFSAGMMMRAMAYGPSQGEYTHDTLYGPLGALVQGDLAVSPNAMGEYPLGSRVNVVDEQGNILLPNQRVADYSYFHPGEPTHNSFEVWNGQDLGRARLQLISGPTSSKTEQPAETEI